MSADITKEYFLAWRSPQRGKTNPQRMTNALWTYLVQNRQSAYKANNEFNGPCSYVTGNSCWSFDRFGQSNTLLADGSTLYIAGEHEDFYDPDFYIYNDVTIINTNGEIEIYGYPVEDFPPTDFHSATLVGDCVFVIGNLGYKEHPQIQVLRLELGTWRMYPVEAVGDASGWLHSHHAALSQDGQEIIVTKGLLQTEGLPLIENIDDWSLNLKMQHWKRLTRRRWTRFIVERQDKKRLHLEDLKQLAYYEKETYREVKEEYKEQYKKYTKEQALVHENRLKEELGFVPDLQLAETIFVPAAADEIIPKKSSLEYEEGQENFTNEQYTEKYHTFRVRINGVVVRYVDEGGVVQVTIEGEVPNDVVENLKSDLVQKASLLEGQSIVCRPIVAN